MVAGFREIQHLKKTKFPGGFEGHFETAFGQNPPKQSTYHDQIKKWNLVAQSAAERNSAGRWSPFSKAVPFPVIFTL